MNILNYIKNLISPMYRHKAQNPRACHNYELRPYLIYVKVGERSFLYGLRAYLIYVKVGERSFLYGLRAYLIYVKVGERSFLYGLRAYLIYVKVGETDVHSDGSQS